MSTSEIITNLLSLIAIIVSVVALIISSKSQKRIEAIEIVREKDRLEEKIKAKLVAKIEKAQIPNYARYYLIVTNIGQGTAKNITIKANNEDVFNSERFEYISDSQPVLSFNASIKIIILDIRGLQPSFYVNVEWVDGSNEKGSYESTVSF